MTGTKHKKIIVERPAPKRIVIIGGGFGGVTLAQRLEKEVSGDAEIVLISRENHLVFSPMLAEAVGRTVSVSNIVVPGREMVKRTRWLTARVTEIDPEKNTVSYVSKSGDKNSLRFDHLVIAVGAVVNLNVVPGLAAYAYPLKSLGDAIYLGNDLIGRLEEAVIETDAEKRRRLLTVAVIGGGFSGVDVAGQIADLMKRAREFYPQLKTEKIRIILLQRESRLLPELKSGSLAEFARVKMVGQGIDVRVNAEVREVTDSGVIMNSGEPIQAGTVVCTVGTATNPLIKNLNLEMERGRLKTGADMRVSNTKNLWSLGDCAAVPNAHDKQTSPPTAQFATRQAKVLAANIALALENKETKPFSFKPLGILASIGDRNAVAEVFGFQLSGLLAWMMWKAIYLMKMPTLARKTKVWLDWTAQIFFPPNFVQIKVSRTNREGRAHFAAGSIVVKAGAAGGRFFIIESGTAQVFADAGDAEPIAVLRAGDHFGDDALFSPDGKTNNFTVRAETPLDLLAMSRADFEQFSKSFGALRRAMGKSFSEWKGLRGFLSAAEIAPALGTIKVSEAMTSPAETLPAAMTFEDAAARFHNGRAGYPVTDDDGKLIGYCGRAELYDAMRNSNSFDRVVGDFMRKSPPCVRADQTLVEAAKSQIGQSFEILTVVAADGSGKIVGVLSSLDMFQKLVKAQKVWVGTAAAAATEPARI